MDVSDSVPLRIQLDERRGVVTLHGDLDSESAPLLIQEVERWMSAGSSALHLDVADLRFVDSAGLRSLLVLRERAARIGATIAVVHPSDATRRLLEIIGLDDVLLLGDDAEGTVFGDGEADQGRAATGDG
jgi:anti-sigma B factor antagonist